MLKTTNSFKKTFIILLAILFAVIALSSFTAYYYGDAQSAKRFMKNIETKYGLDLPDDVKIKAVYSQSYIDGEEVVIQCRVKGNYELKYETQFISYYREGEFDIEKALERPAFTGHYYFQPSTDWWGREEKTTYRFRDLYILYDPLLQDLTILYEVHQYFTEFE